MRFNAIRLYMAYPDNDLLCTSQELIDIFCCYLKRTKITITLSIMTADPFIIAALNEPTIIFHSDTAEICCK